MRLKLGCKFWNKARILFHPCLNVWYLTFFVCWCSHFYERTLKFRQIILCAWVRRRNVKFRWSCRLCTIIASHIDRFLILTFSILINQLIVFILIFKCFISIGNKYQQFFPWELKWNSESCSVSRLVWASLHIIFTHIIILLDDSDRTKYMMYGSNTT